MQTALARFGAKKGINELAKFYYSRGLPRVKDDLRRRAHALTLNRIISPCAIMACSGQDGDRRADLRFHGGL